MQPPSLPLDRASPASQLGPEVLTAIQGNAEQLHPTAGVPAILRRELGVH